MVGVYDNWLFNHTLMDPLPNLSGCEAETTNKEEGEKMKTEKTIRKEFARFLKKRRIECGLTQAALAKKSGLSQDWICHFERGSRLPSHVALMRLLTPLKACIITF